MKEYWKYAAVALVLVLAWKFLHKKPAAQQVAIKYPWNGMGATPNPDIVGANNPYIPGAQIPPAGVY